MAATTEGAVDVPLETFGGLATDMAAADLPAGISPDCADVRFIQGGVQTRPGLKSMITNGGPSTQRVQYLKTYITQNLTQRMLVLDDLGNFYKEGPEGTLTLVSNALNFITPTGRLYARSASVFGREYLAFHDGKFGVDMPRQFDDTNFDRVSQAGPGMVAGFAAADEAVTGAIISPTLGVGAVRASRAVTISFVTRALGVSTVLTTAAHGFGVGEQVVISGITDTSFNGTFTVLSVPTTTTFTYAQASFGDGLSGTGTATINEVTITTTGPHGFQVGWAVNISNCDDPSFDTSATGPFVIATIPSNTTFTFTQPGAGAASQNGTVKANLIGHIPSGQHQCVVFYETRQGYRTAPSPAIFWSAEGGRRVVISGIPIGPPNVTKRILAFTTSIPTTVMLTAKPAGNFYFIPPGGTIANSNMVIPDNTTTSITLDFSDTALAAATLINADAPAKSLFRLIELPECAGVIDYASRLFWWGERNRIGNFSNLSFDGGRNASTVGPSGWTLDPVFGAGASQDASLALWGFAYRITGDGIMATRGFMTQSAYLDPNAVPILSPSTGYSVRARVIANGLLTQGTLHIHLFSATASIDAGLDVTPAQAQATGTYVELTASLTSGMATVPTDLLLRVYADGTPTNGGYFEIENIEVFPTNQPYNTSLVRASRVEDPESYDGVNGLLLVSDGDGQRLTTAFVFRDNLYFAKERGMYVTADDGVNEPALWKINTISKTVGAISVHAVDYGEDWVILAGRAGVYIFWGPEPVKISQAIQPLWDTINWQYGHTIWVRVDTRNKRILVGVPLGAATIPNRVLMMDYRNLESAEAIASAKSIRYSAYSGKILALGNARKWCPWRIAANSAALIERADGTAQMFLGNGAGTGKIYQLTDTYFKDDDVVGTAPSLAINGYYTTYFFLDQQQEQGLRLGSNRKLFKLLTLYCAGNGTLKLSAFQENLIASVPLPTLTLKNPPVQDLEQPITGKADGRHVAFRIETNAVDEWFQLQRFTPWLIPDPHAPIRGFN